MTLTAFVRHRTALLLVASGAAIAAVNGLVACAVAGMWMATRTPRSRGLDPGGGSP
jgi:hypothetical protein